TNSAASEQPWFGLSAGMMIGPNLAGVPAGWPVSTAKASLRMSFGDTVVPPLALIAIATDTTLNFCDPIAVPSIVLAANVTSSAFWLAASPFILRICCFVLAGTVNVVLP